MPELDSLVVRQNNNNNNPEQSSPTPTRGSQTTGQASRTTNNPSASITNPPSTDSDSESSARGSGSGTATGTGSRSGSQRSSTRSATRTRTTSYDERLPAGGVTMATPAPTDGEQLFKIGDFVTFAWNYTSLLASPTAVKVYATCKANNQLYTLAENVTISNDQKVIWDTKSYQAANQGAPLMTEKYNLIILDVDASVTDNARPGYLAPYNQLTFGMYTPQPYVPLSEFVCATCSGALGDVEKRALGMVLGTAALTVLSFTWFVGGTGIIF